MAIRRAGLRIRTSGGRPTILLISGINSIANEHFLEQLGPKVATILKGSVGIQARLSAATQSEWSSLICKGWGAFPDKGVNTLRHKIMIGLAAAAAIIASSSTLSAQYRNYGRQYGGYTVPRGQMGRPLNEFGLGRSEFTRRGEFDRGRREFSRRGEFDRGRGEFGPRGEFGRNRGDFGRGRQWEREGEPD
jgi:hypothetical protein